MTGINSTGSSNGPAGQAPGAAISPAPGPREGQLLIASCNLNFVLSAYLRCLFTGGAGRPAGPLAAGLSGVVEAGRVETAPVPAVPGRLTGGRDHLCSSGRRCDFGGLVRAAGDKGRRAHMPGMGSAGRRTLHGASGLRFCVTGRSVASAVRSGI